MSISSFAGIVQGITSEIFVKLIISIWRRIRITAVFAISAYRSRLLDRLAEMPFLYKDIKLSARDDYVQLQIATALDGLNRTTGNADLDFRTPFQRVQESRRALFFGGGGYGKTSFFRHLAIRCLQQKWRSPILDGKRLVPIFIALKTVKASDYPVLDAIRQSDDYFRGGSGLRRLRRLARTRRLLVFLDGYDEMPYVGGTNHVQEELSTFFGTYNSNAPNFFEACEHKEIYKAIQKCRVYLSTRQEYFYFKPLHVSGDVVRWVINGLDSRRIELVRNLFEKYARTVCIGIDLDAELFMQELEMSKDSELLALSRSPLFLTVISYVYASDIRRKGASSVFMQGAYEITLECISLLVSELDAAKARDLSDAQRQALMNRRSSFPNEKIAFLRYFSVQLYERSISLFDRDNLRDIAFSFFQSSDFANNNDVDKILSGLHDTDPTTNVLEQIILSGIFNLVDRRNGIDYFDFPHRRFRETLAISYFNNKEGVDALISRLRDPEYSELILVYIRQSSFRFLLLEAMIREVVETGNLQVSKLLASSLSELAKDDAHRLVCDLLVRIDPDHVPDLPSSLVPMFMLNDDSRRLVLENIRSACDSRRDRWLMLWLKIANALSISIPTNFVHVERLAFSLSRIFLYEGLRVIALIENSILEQFVVAGIEEGAELSELVEDCYIVLFGGRNQNAQRSGLITLRHLRDRLNGFSGQAYKSVCERLSKMIELVESKGTWEGGVSRPPAPRSPWRATKM